MLLSWLERCRWLYNGALEERRCAFAKQKVTVTRYDQQKALTELRKQDGDWSEVPVNILRSALKRLDLAYKAFFRRVKAGEKPGFPRFRSRDRYASFSLMSAVPRIEDSRVFLPKLGPVKFHEYRPLKGVVKDVLVRRSAGKWYVCFQCDLGEAPKKVAVRPERTVGIDLGLNVFAALSDGTAVDNPRYFRRSEQLLADRQRKLAKKRKGSNSRRRARLLVAKAHEHIRNQRLDFSRKLAKDLCDRYDLIAHEDLAIRNMVRNERLSKSINDAAWNTFLHCLTCEAEEAGKHVVAVDPRGTTQECSGCGRRVKKGFADRVHQCSCGRVMCRDLNAAHNIHGRGLRLVAAAEAFL